MGVARERGSRVCDQGRGATRLRCSRLRCCRPAGPAEGSCGAVGVVGNTRIAIIAGFTGGLAASVGRSWGDLHEEERCEKWVFSLKINEETRR